MDYLCAVVLLPSRHQSPGPNNIMVMSAGANFRDQAQPAAAP